MFFFPIRISIYLFWVKDKCFSQCDMEKKKKANNQRDKSREETLAAQKHSKAEKITSDIKTGIMRRKKKRGKAERILEFILNVSASFVPLHDTQFAKYNTHCKWWLVS